MARAFAPVADDDDRFVCFVDVEQDVRMALASGVFAVAPGIWWWDDGKWSTRRKGALSLLVQIGCDCMIWGVCVLMRAD